MRLLILFSLVLYHVAVQAWSTLDNWADVVLLQTRAHRPLPTITAFEPTLNFEDAYGIQRLVVKELGAGEALVGFRSDLTSPLLRARLRSAQPITSAVLKDQWLKPGAWVTRPPGSKIQLAPALGFTLERAITAHIGTPTELPPMVRDVRPVVILVDYSFDDTAPPTALDLVAANGAPARLIVGQPFKSTDAAMIDATFVEMHREDQVVVRGKATNVMGGQYEALRWQVNELLARGWTLKAGQLLVTGPLSEPVPADVGDWKADYWERGALDFSVEYGRPR